MRVSLKVSITSMLSCPVTSTSTPNMSFFAQILQITRVPKSRHSPVLLPQHGLLQAYNKA